MPTMKFAATGVVILALTAIMLSASVWQAQRGLSKQQLADARSDAAQLQPVPFDPALAYGQPVSVTGTLVTDQQILLDNQLVDHRNGVHVWTPMRLTNGDLVLINRGWIAASPDRRETPRWETPGGRLSLSGYWVRLPRAGVKVANNDCDAPQWPVRMVYPSHAEVACLYDAPLADGIVQLDPGAQHGFVRDWSVAGLSPSRHFGYALQWLALTVCLWILVLIAWKRRDRSPIKR